MNGFKSRLLVLTICVVASLALAAPASALERFATPGGATTGNCIAVACSLERAVEDVATDGDVVTVAAGNYTAGVLADDQIGITDAITVRGAPGAARPKLISQAPTAVGITNPGAVLRRLEVDHQNNSAVGATALAMTGGVAEQVIATGIDNDANAAACQMSGLGASGATIRDSVCRNTGGRQALEITDNSGTQTAVVRNSTLIATDSGGTPTGNALLAGTQGGAVLNVDVANTIASSFTDVNAQQGLGGSTTTVTMTRSNYDSELQVGGATVTNPGTGGNQTAAPIFVNATAGDFHQTTASPTKNAGSATVSNLGSADIDGELRFLGTAPDIGADEFTEAAPDGDGDGVIDVSDSCVSQPGPPSNNGCPLPPADTGGGQAGGGGDTGGGNTGGGGATPDTDDPETEITKKPKKELRAGDTAKVSFSSDEDGSTFECKVGKGGKFKSCTSPAKIKDLEKGKTKFQVRAVDAAGNADETPAKLTIEVSRKTARGG